MWWLWLSACGGSGGDAVPTVPLLAPTPTLASKSAARGPAAALARMRNGPMARASSVTDEDLVAVLRDADAWPPGMREAPPVKETAAERSSHPIWLELQRPTGEWLEAGGRAIVSGATPTGGTVRATLRGDAATAFTWVYEHGDGRVWEPLATVAWEKAAP